MGHSTSSGRGNNATRERPLPPGVVEATPEVQARFDRLMEDIRNGEIEAVRNERWRSRSGVDRSSVPGVGGAIIDENPDRPGEIRIRTYIGNNQKEAIVHLGYHGEFSNQRDKERAREKAKNYLVGRLQPRRR